MSEIELPALPARLLRFQTEFRDGERLDYSANQMREYARAAVLAERERCAKACEDLDLWDMDDPGASAAAAIRRG